MRVVPGLKYSVSEDLGALEPAELIKRAWRALRGNAWIVAACVAVFVILGGLYTQAQAPFYGARASIIIDPRVGEDITNAPQAATVLLADDLVVDSEIAVLASRDLLGGVVDRLDLVTPTRVQMMEAALAEGLPAPDEAAIRRQAIDDLSDSVTVSRDGTTYVLRIFARADSPERAAAIANAIADVYFEERAAVQLDRIKSSRDYIQSRLGALSLEVMTAEKRVEDYKYENAIQDDSESRQGPLYQEMAENEAALIRARGTIGAAQTEIGTLDQALARIAAAPEGSRGSAAAAESGLVAALGGEINPLSNRVVDELRQLRDQRAVNVSILEGQITSLDKRNTELRDEIARIVSSQVELRELTRNATALKTQYESLLANYEDAQTDAGFHRSNARVIERAVEPTAPGNPSGKLVIVAAALGGILVGFGLVFLREQMDDTVRSSDDVARRLGSLYLGPFPRLSRRETLARAPKQDPAGDPLDARARLGLGRLSFVRSNPLSLAAETLRRTLIEIETSGARTGRPLWVAVLSAFPGEGKTTFAANLAFLAAQQGLRVVLVDGDLRNQSLSAALHPVAAAEPVALDRNGALALTPLSDRLALASLAHLDQDEAARTLVRLDEHLAAAGRTPDLLVFDTPPLAYIPDSLLLMDRLDVAALVVRWGRTTVSDLKRVLPRSGRLAEKIVGVSLTQMTPRQIRRYEAVSMKGYYGRYDRPRPAAELPAVRKAAGAAHP